MTTAQLTRTTFTTSRLMEFFTEKELAMQIGHSRPWWPSALVKELIDNALDACESAGIPPEITVTVESHAVTVQDNGPGLPVSTLERSLDYLVRVSDKGLYVSPTRGQLGNALKCVWAAPFVVDGSQGHITVQTDRQRHEITVTLDRIAQEPRLEMTTEEDGVVKSGTLVRMEWAEIARHLNGEVQPSFYIVPRFATLVRNYAACNPHATFHLTTPKNADTWRPTAPAWRKWRPSDPTSPHWYTPERLRALIAGYLRMGATSPVRTVRELVAEFAGLSGSGKQKAVAAAAGLAGATLRDLVRGDDVDLDAVGRLLGAMQQAARPVKPEALGVLGEEHLTASLVGAFGASPDGVRYKRTTGEADGLPFALEVAFAVNDEEHARYGRDLAVLLNWSPTLRTPMHELQTALAKARVDTHDPVSMVVHLACPRLEFIDRGKTTLSLSPDIAEALARSIESVTKSWKDAKRGADRQDQLTRKRLETLRKVRRASTRIRDEEAAARADTGYGRIKRLVEQRGGKVGDYLALHPKNDPFYAGSPAQRQRAEWFARLWAQFGYTDLSDIHLRRIHYRMLALTDARRADGQPYENTETCWAYLNESSKFARYLGLVDAGKFADRRNPEPTLFTTEGRITPAPTWTVDLPMWELPEIETGFAAHFGLDLPEVAVTGYDYNPADQPYHVEVWIEKSTMADVLIPLCQELGIGYVPSVGFQSITGVRDLLTRTAASGKPARVRYISDFDPAGDRMPVQVARQAEFWLPRVAPGADIKLRPLLLTRTQVEQYQLPRKPVRDTDNRKRGFEKRRGEGAVELDALEALHPGDLARVVREAVQPFRDPALADRLRAAQKDAREKVTGIWDDAFALHRDEIKEAEDKAREIAERYHGRIEEFQQALMEELTPIRERLENVRRAVQTKADNAQTAVILPLRPEPALTDPPESDGWLYDSSRDSLAQLAVYKAYS